MTRLRCAIYTRKSSEEGLEQSFNSLHAQREACEAYMKSQAGEGWSVVRKSYDDGGFSGGSIERPALRRLLEDIEAGAVDVVVVYKVDRLTRSLNDFARIIEVLDRNGASFVSVTQAFNTTSSMGRLTLNVLLSFAQFEREVTGERIRDKIAASKAKGMWMGGNLPLGYESRERRLIIVPEEAETVRLIFSRYLELRSVHALVESLDADRIISKRRVSKSGRVSGGQPFSRGALFHLLQNRVYLGEIVHKGEAHPGLHDPIVDRELFAQVHAQLAENRRGRGEVVERSRAPLTGRLFDSTGDPMSPTTAYGRNGRRYRYYVSAKLQQGERNAGRDVIRRIPAADAEELVLHRLRRLADQPNGGWRQLGHILRQVQLHPDAISIALNRPRGVQLSHRLVDGDRLDEMDSAEAILMVPVRPQLRGGRTWLIGPGGQVNQAKPDASLIQGLRRAHQELRIRNSHPQQDLAHASGIESPYLRKLVRLAFLAPDIQKAILEGRQPPGLTLKRLMEPLSASWAEQRRALGFPQPR